MYPKVVGVSGLTSCDNIIIITPAGVHDVPTYVPVATLGQSIREKPGPHNPGESNPELLCWHWECQRLAHGRTRLCGLTPGQAPPTSHQVPSCSHQAQVLCVAPDSQHQTLHSGVVNYNGPPKGLTKGCWASSSRRKQAGLR